MESDDFHYDPDQWKKIVEIVEAAGGAVAKKKLEAKRAYLEQKVGWRLSSLERRVGVKRAALPSLAVRYQRVAEASAKLKTALSDLKWIFFADGEESWTQFTSTLDHIHRVAEKRMTPRRYSKDAARNSLFDQVGLFWEEYLSLPEAHGPGARMVKFIGAACCGVYALSTISNALQRDHKRAARKQKRKQAAMGVKISPRE